MTDDTYTCARCGETYTKGWSDEDAAAESVAIWGDVPQTDLAVICDDCFPGATSTASYDPEVLRVLAAWDALLSGKTSKLVLDIPLAALETSDD